jgi:hypothetical protein
MLSNRIMNFPTTRAGDMHTPAMPALPWIQASAPRTPEAAFRASVDRFAAPLPNHWSAAGFASRALAWHDSILTPLCKSRKDRVLTGPAQPHKMRACASEKSVSEWGMSQPPIDLEYVNDNLPIEYQIGAILRWAEQSGFPHVAATLQRALDELVERTRVSNLT